MKHKGFTLVEMMAVIAVLGLLVVLVLPNVLKSYRDAKKVSFINEAKTIYKASTDKYVSEKTKGKKIGLIQKEKDSVVNELALNEASDLNYTIRLDSEGRVTAFKLTNSEYCIVGVGDFLGTYEKEDVIELSDEERAEECNVTAIQDNQKFILRLQNKETVKGDYNPKIIYLKYNVGWFNDNNMHNSIESVTIPYKENYYYEGAWATNTLGSSIQAISCDGLISQDKTGGGIFTGKEPRPYVEAFSRFTKKNYKVSFTGGIDATGNIGTIKCDYGSSECKIPSNLGLNGYGKDIKKTGYLFTGWKSGTNTYTDAQTLPVLTDENEDEYPFYKFDNEDVCGGVQDKENTLTFSAVWEPIKYIISYNCNGGTGSTASSNHTYDEEKKLTTNGCSKTGYNFLGWSKNSNSTNAEFSNEQSVKNLTTINNDTITLHAIWSAKTVTVVYNRNNNSSDTETKTQTFTYDVSGNRFGYNSNGTPKWGLTGQFGSWNKTGYTLLGWNTNRSASSQTYVPYWNVTNDFINTNAGKTVDLFGIWKPNVYTITLDKQGGKNGTNYIYEKYENGYYLDAAATNKKMSTTSNAISVPTRTNYSFAGYFTSTDVLYIGKSGKLTSNASNTNFTSNGNLSAKWCNNCESVSNGSCKLEVSESGSCTYTTSCSKGYKLSNNGNYNPTCNPVEYYVKYDANDGTGTMSNSEHTYNVSKNLTLNTYTKGGYIFAGWSIEKDKAVTYSDGESVKNLTDTDGAEVTIYAKWTQCPAGTYSDSEANKCIKCSAGTYSLAGSASCTPCATGSYNKDIGQTKCIACQNGKTTTGVGQTSCNKDCSNKTSAVSSWKTASWTSNSVTNLCIINSCLSCYKLDSNKCNSQDIFYVSSNGSDSNGGYASNIPFKTIQKAYDCPGDLTIKLSSNIEQNRQLNFTASKKVVLTSDSDVKTISRSSSYNTGPIIYSVNGSLTIKNITIDGKNIASKGSAIYAVISKLDLSEGTTIKNNICTEIWRPGGVYCSGWEDKNAELQLNGAVITNNASLSTDSPDGIGGQGGGMLVDGNCIFTMNSGKVTKNRSNRSAGGIFVHGTTFKLKGGEISENTGKEGGGLYIRSTEFEMTGGKIINNRAGLGGAMIYGNDSFAPTYWSHGNITGGTITGNTADSVNGIYIRENSGGYLNIRPGIVNN